MKKVYLIKKIQKKTVLFAAAAAFFAGAFGTQPAYAASYVNSVRIQLDIDLEDGDSLPHLDIGYTGDSSAEVAVPSSQSGYAAMVTDATATRAFFAVTAGKKRAKNAAA